MIVVVPVKRLLCRENYRIIDTAISMLNLCRHNYKYGV